MTIKVTKSTPHGEELRAALQRAADRRERSHREDMDALELERMFQCRRPAPIYLTVNQAARKTVSPKRNNLKATILLAAGSIMSLLLAATVYLGVGPCSPVTILASVGAVLGVAGGLV